MVAVSEIVTNALAHSGLDERDHVELRVTPIDERLRVGVRHRGSPFPTSRPPPEQGQVGGWGLHLVGALTKDWGVERLDAHRVLVWFEL